MSVVKLYFATGAGRELPKKEEVIPMLVSTGCFLVLYYLTLIVFDGAVADRQWKDLRGQYHNELTDWDPDQAEGDSILKNSIGVFKGGPDNYLLTFAEVRPNRQRMVFGEEAFNDNLFPPLWQNKSNIRRRRDEEVTVSLENKATPAGDHHSEVVMSSVEAEEVVSAVLKSTEGMRKGLGVCRKHVPKNFFNPPIDNVTNVVIKSIVGCVEEKLQDDLTCRDCITLHGDLQLFVNWLMHGNTGLTCCPSVDRKIPSPETKKHLFLFSQESFGGSKCGSTMRPTAIPTVCEVVTQPNSEQDSHPKKKTDPLVNF